MENRKSYEYPGGWKLTDDRYMQYVRRHGLQAYPLTKGCPMTHSEPLYEAYTNRVYLSDYEARKIEENKAFPVETIHEYLLLPYDAPEVQRIAQVSMEEFVCKMLNLRVDETLDFFEYEDGDMYGVVKVKHFHINMLLINGYGDYAPLVIALNEDADSDKLSAQVSERFKAYCEANGIGRLHISLEPKVDTLCPEAQEMRGRKQNALLSKDVLMERLSAGGYTDRTLSEIRDEYMEALGFDPIWRYPFYHDGKLGAVLIPVTEGFLWLPYSIVEIEDNEKYEPENTALLDAKTCEWLIEEMERYTEPLTAVMRYVADELKETEELTMGRKYGVVCPVCPCPL